MVPGKHLVDRPFAVAVEGDVNPQLGERLPPEPGIEVFAPRIEPGPRRQAARRAGATRLSPRVKIPSSMLRSTSWAFTVTERIRTFDFR